MDGPVRGGEEQSGQTRFDDSWLLLRRESRHATCGWKLFREAMAWPYVETTSNAPRSSAFSAPAGAALLQRVSGGKAHLLCSAPSLPYALGVSREQGVALNRWATEDV